VYTLVVSAKDGSVVHRLPISTGEWLIGRQEGNAVVLQSPSVSRQHARIYTAQGRCFIQDLKSANGVYMDGRKVEEVEEIRAGQDIIIGEFTICLEPEGGGEGGAPGLNTHIVSQEREFARIVGLNGPFEGEEFTLSEKENTIGRTEENLILLPDPSVSRQHARVVVEDNGRHVVFDLHSSNGSYVNRKRIQRAVLRDGDVLTIGNVSFRFVVARSKGGEAGASAGSGRRRSVIVWALVGLLLVMAGLTVGLVLYKSHKRRLKQKEAQQAYQKAVVSGREAVGAKEWEGAIEQLGRAVEFNPTEREIQGLLAKARAEQGHQAALRRGDDLFAMGRLEEARKVLEGIPGNSGYHAAVAGKLKEIKGRLAKKYFQDGKTASRKKRYKEAHDLLIKALDADPTDDSALKLVRRIERKLKKKRIDFEPWSPSDGGGG
jgi:pSer/pThr/pTyr-binding forkhead associated (FHA) protein